MIRLESHSASLSSRNLFICSFSEKLAKAQQRFKERRAELNVLEKTEADKKMIFYLFGKERNRWVRKITAALDKCADPVKVQKIRSMFDLNPASTGDQDSDDGDA